MPSTRTISSWDSVFITRIPWGEHIVQVYYAPVGDPVLAPSPFRIALPQASYHKPLSSHHWQDSSHIANNVYRRIMHKKIRLEASGFYGRSQTRIAGISILAHELLGDTFIRTSPPKTG